VSRSDAADLLILGDRDRRGSKTESLATRGTREGRTRHMHASPPALIDACMSFRIDQLREVRTAPAAHGGRRWPEGPMRLPQAGPAMARHSWAVWWPMMAEGRQRPTSSILAAIAQGRAVRLMMVGAHVTVRRRGSLCRVHGSIVDETRNAEDRRELPGRVGGPRRSRGW
jgi:hypothetical protein